MPLTAQLQHGVLGEWCARRFSGTGRVIGRVRAAAGPTDPIRPIGVVDVRHWSIVGGALAQRFGFAVQHAPPYGALLGCYRSGLADWAHVQELAASFPTHRSLDARRSRATQLRPLPGGGWTELARRPPVSARAGALGRRPDLVESVVRRLLRLLEDHTPPGRIAAARGVEALLARICVVLSTWEDALYGTGVLPGALDLYATPGISAEGVLNAVSERQVAEIVAVLARAESSGVLDGFREAARRGDDASGVGIAAPVVIEQWAGADALTRAPGVGAGMTVLGIKSVASLHDGGRIARWLWHLVACAWLDGDDALRIRSAGLYLARHGVLVTWTLEELTAALLDGADATDAARAFRALAEPVIARETGLVGGTDVLAGRR